MEPSESLAEHEMGAANAVREGAQAAQALAKLRRRVNARCEQCGREIEGIRAKRFCSNACRMRASRARRGGSAEAIGAELVELGAAVERLLQLIDRTPNRRGLRSEALRLKVAIEILQRQNRDGRESIHVVRGA